MAKEFEAFEGWTGKHQDAALADGWGIFENSDHGYRIERFDEMARFNSDAAATAYVAARAMHGDKLAQRAVVELAHWHAVWDAAHPENNPIRGLATPNAA